MACPLVLAFILLAVKPATPVSPPVLHDEPTSEWRWGPARYILKIREEEKYRALTTEAERQAFIEKFWHDLDPTPDTPFNETRDEFWRRVNLAQALFSHKSVYPGWKTDRGKIYILLGPPHEIDLHGGRYGTSETWTYRGLPIPNTPPEVRLVFTGRDLSGPALARYFPLVRSRGGYLGDSPISVRFDVGSVQVIPGRILLPETHVATEYFFPTLRTVEDYRTFRAEDGSTFLVLDLAVEDVGASPKTAKPSEELVLSGTIFRQGQSEPAAHFVRTLKPEGPPGADPMRYRARFDLPSGQYRAECTLLDPVTHQGAMFHPTLVVPDYRDAFSMSSLTVTRPPKAAPEARGPGANAPPWKLAEHSTFVAGEVLYVTYQVYGVDGPAVDVEYRFYRMHGEAQLAVGAPVERHGLPGGTLGYALPLKGWPEGEYRVQVMVSDPVSGSGAFREASFRIDANSKSAPSRREKS